MKITKTGLDGCYIIEPQVFGDSRGWFYESYSASKFRELGINTEFVQDNRSFSAQKGTLRGLHCQTEPMAQTKLISCTRGAFLDVVVDVRTGSPTFMKSISAELSAENKLMLYIPKGFLHGFLTLTDNVEAYYKVDRFYSPENDRSIRFNDPVFHIDWGISDPVLSAKDMNAPFFEDSDVRFVYDR